MPVQAFISINYTAGSREEVQAFVDKTAFPEGASISASITEQVASGVVEGGAIKGEEPPAPPVAPPAPSELAEPPPEQSAGAPPEGTVQEVMDWVGDDRVRAQAALDAERVGQDRTTLVSQLEALLAQEPTP